MGPTYSGEENMAVPMPSRSNIAKAANSSKAPAGNVISSVQTIASSIEEELKLLEGRLQPILALPSEKETGRDSMPEEGTSSLVSALSSHQYDLLKILDYIRSIAGRVEV